MVDKFVERLLVDLARQIQVVEQVFEVLSRDEATFLFVHDGEEIGHVIDLRAFGSFDNLVDNHFFFGVVLDAIPLKFSDKLVLINITRPITIQRIPQNIDLSHTQSFINRVNSQHLQRPLELSLIEPVIARFVKRVKSITG